MRISYLLTNFLLLLSITLIPSRNKCILEKIIADLKLNSLQEAGKNTDENDPIIKILTSKGNHDQNILIQKMITNYSLLPKDFQRDLENCETKLDIAIKKCEIMHGKGNCDKKDMFTVQVKCPEGFKPDDYTRCVRECKPKDIIIDFNCNSRTTMFLSQDIMYNNKEECDFRSKYECVIGADGEGTYVEGCPPEYKQIAFICVPMCFNEINEEILEKLRKMQGYCVKDYVEISLPFYEL